MFRKTKRVIDFHGIEIHAMFQAGRKPRLNCMQKTGGKTPESIACRKYFLTFPCISVTLYPSEIYWLRGEFSPEIPEI